MSNVAWSTAPDQDERPKKPVSPARAQTPALLQMEAAECGAAALGIILGYYGRIEPLAVLRRACGVSRDGSKASNVLKAARGYGLVAGGYSKDLESVQQLKTPFIVFWKFNHFVVVEGFKRGRVYFNDPAVGHRTVTAEEFEEGFTGVVLTFEPGPEFRKGGKKPSLLRALTERIRGFRSAVAFSILAGFLLVIPGLVTPAFSQIFVDQVLISQRDGWLRPLITAMLVMAVARVFLKLLQLGALRRLRLALSARMSAQFFQHLLRLPVNFYVQRFPGEIAARSQLNDKVAGILSGQLAQTAIDVVMMVFYLAMMLAYSLPLTLIGLASATINFVTLHKFARWRREANMRLQQEHGKVAGVSIAGLQGIETLKASGMESGFFTRWAGQYTKATNVQQEICHRNTFLNLVPRLLSSVTTLLVLVVGSLAVIDGSLTIGSLVAVQMLMSSFLRPIGNLVSLGKTIQELEGDMTRLDDVLAHPPEPGTENSISLEDSELDYARAKGFLELEDVTFGYSPLEPPLIENFSLSIQPGQRIALVGGSGSGKSTIAKLIAGLYQPWSGGILIDGISRSELPRAFLANSLSLVDQEVMLFGGTVRENLTLWDPTVPDAVLTRACRDASIHDRVQALPGGLDAETDEGARNLSGGERQRIEIARALVDDPSILVLDEATSALDTESERQIVDRISLRGCSCVIVAHRLSTIRDCDEIIVLDHGRVMERGTHEELWGQGGAYAALLAADHGLEPVL